MRQRMAASGGTRSKKRKPPTAEDEDDAPEPRAKRKKVAGTSGGLDNATQASDPSERLRSLRPRVNGKAAAVGGFETGACQAARRPRGRPRAARSISYFQGEIESVK